MDNYYYALYQIERKLRRREKWKRKNERCVWVIGIVAVIAVAAMIKLM